MSADAGAAATGWLQANLPAALRPLVDLASLLGGTAGWMLLVGLAFWWSGSRLGVRVALVTSLSALLNVELKWLFHQPRPYLVSGVVVPLRIQDGFGMPSGHAQGSASVWGALACWSALGRDRGRRWLWAAGAVAILLAGLARVYYGVHSPLQVVCGWAAGVAVVTIAAALEPQVSQRWAELRQRGRWTLAALAPLALLGLGLVVREVALAGWVVPSQWQARHLVALARLGATVEGNQLRLFDAAVLLRWVGGLAGALAVAAWYSTPGRPAAIAGPLGRRLAATVIGTALAAAVLAAGELVAPWAAGVGELVRFALAMWAMGVVAPWLGSALVPDGAAATVPGARPCGDR